MNREPNVLPYVGRSIDLLLMDNIPSSQTTLLIQSLVLPGQAGAAITGIQKLAQRFLLELLTDQGSLTYLPNRGTQFMLQLRSGAMRTAADVRSAFILAESTARGTLRREQSPTAPADEKYVRAELLSVTLEADLISLRIQVISEAGSDVVLIYPIAINPS
jgi:hypothetical protein